MSFVFHMDLLALLNVLGYINEGGKSGVGALKCGYLRFGSMGLPGLNPGFVYFSDLQGFWEVWFI
jgi:hypothetical protein